MPAQPPQTEPPVDIPEPTELYIEPTQPPLFSYVQVDDGIEITGFNYEFTETFLTIPGEIDGCIVVGIGEGAFENNFYIQEIDIANNVQYINNNAFRNCENLTNITIGTNVQRIGDFAFSQLENNVRSFIFKTYYYSNIEMGESALGASEEATIACTNDYLSEYYNPEYQHPSITP